MKRGMSPLIAMVIIIGFLIVLSVIVFKWGGGIVQKELGETQGISEIAEIALRTDIVIHKVRPLGKYVEITLENIGQEDIADFTIRVSGAEDSVTIDNVGNLDRYTVETFRLDVGDVGELEDVLVVPRILFDGEEQTLEYNRYEIGKGSGDFCRNVGDFYVVLCDSLGDGCGGEDYLVNVVRDELGFDVNLVIDGDFDRGSVGDYDIVMALGHKDRPREIQNIEEGAYDKGYSVLTTGPQHPNPNPCNGGDCADIFFIDDYDHFSTHPFSLNFENECDGHPLCAGKIEDMNLIYATSNNGAPITSFDDDVAELLAIDTDGMEDPTLLVVDGKDEGKGKWAHIHADLYARGNIGDVEQKRREILYNSISWLTKDIC